MQNNEQNPENQMMKFITAKWISQPIYVAAKLGIPDILAAGPLSITELAKRCQCQSNYLYRILRALTAIGIFKENEQKYFELTPLAEYLQSNKLRAVALLFLSDWHNQAWDQLLKCVHTGEIPFQTAFGIPCFEWLNQNPAAQDIFHQANAMKAAQTHSVIIHTYDFTPFNNIIDIGGGYGGLIFKILENNPHLQGMIADLPSIVEDVHNQIIKKGLEDRCQAHSCDFFKAIPKNKELYLLSHILHDWDDQHCKKILINCNRAMTTASRLLIVENIISDDDEFGIAKLLDLEVLVMGGGQERTSQEYQNLLNQCGFLIQNIMPTKSSVSLIECIKKKN
ncbi:MAG: acetylserotonin O-methyltransferase [Spirochaetes bacterium]|nr:acetylserotonin O-methyltransferase [Spirochaetota bacterium]